MPYYNRVKHTVIFVLAGLYNIAFAGWLFLSPETLFGLIEVLPPFTTPIGNFLALSIAMASLIYFCAIIKPEWLKWLTVLALITKVLPLITLLLLIYSDDWSPRLLIFIFFNDMIWWIPLLLFYKKAEKY